MSILRDLMDLTVGQCHLCVYLDTLPEMAQSEWNVALAKPVSEVGNTAIVEYLSSESQMYTTEASVRRHRKNHVV